MILVRALDNGGSIDFWPNPKEAAALRALENRKFVGMDDDAMRAGIGRCGMIYRLTETGTVAAQMAKNTAERTEA